MFQAEVIGRQTNMLHHVEYAVELGLCTPGQIAVLTSGQVSCASHDSSRF